MIVFVMYDGIKNSIFYSQVLTPLLKRLREDEQETITIVSFEKEKVSEKIVQKINSAHPRLKLIIEKKYAFFGRPSLWPCVFSLVRILKNLRCEEIMARGPFAGWIVQKAVLRIEEKPEVVVQARGLAAEEFRYAAENQKSSICRWNHSTKSLLKNLFDFYNLLENIERETYSNKSCSIETVSPALKKYLIDNFGADSNRVSVSRYDIPTPAITEQDVAAWRAHGRKEFGIPQDAYVYCYAGSARPWQCVDEMIDFCVSKKDDPKAFFLFLSAEKEVFEKKLHGKIPQSLYVALSVPPDKIYEYLSIADAGLLFRKKDPANWVSRPTKMLEYQAVGLKIIHNDTVEWLVAGRT